MLVALALRRTLPASFGRCFGKMVGSPAGVTILDGGMGHLLRKKGVEIKGPIGSVERFLGVAMANIDQPDLVREAHEDFIRAGATVVTTNSYACVPRIVGDTERSLQVTRAAGAIAREVADRNQVLVAGCMPPLNASYRPDVVGEDDELVREYALIAETIAPYADIMLCETMSCAREAAAAASAAAATGLPVWVSWALAEDSSGKLLSGESVEEAVEALRLEPGGSVAACLFNCSLPESISAALPRLRQVLPAGIATGAFANSFQSVALPGGGNQEYRKDLSPEDYAQICSGWTASGSTIVGGCCGMMPEHIEAIMHRLSLQSPESPPQL